MDDDAANLVANFASGGLGMALDQISRAYGPRKVPPPPRPPCPFKVVRNCNSFTKLNFLSRLRISYVVYQKIGLAFLKILCNMPRSSYDYEDILLC